MFYQYVYDKTDKLEKMQMDLFTIMSIVWNDNLAEETDNEGSDGKEEHLQNIHKTRTKNSSPDLAGRARMSLASKIPHANHKK